MSLPISLDRLPDWGGSDTSRSRADKPSSKNLAKMPVFRSARKQRLREEIYELSAQHLDRKLPPEWDDCDREYYGCDSLDCLTRLPGLKFPEVLVQHSGGFLRHEVWELDYPKTIFLLRDGKSYYFWEYDSIDVFLITGIRQKSDKKISLADILDHLESFSLEGFYSDFLMRLILFRLDNAPPGWLHDHPSLSSIVDCIKPSHGLWTYRGGEKSLLRPLLISKDLSMVIFSVNGSWEWALWSVGAPHYALSEYNELTIDKLLDALDEEEDAFMLTVLFPPSGNDDELDRRIMTFEQFRDIREEFGPHFEPIEDQQAWPTFETDAEPSSESP